MRLQGALSTRVLSAREASFSRDSGLMDSAKLTKSHACTHSEYNDSTQWMATWWKQVLNVGWTMATLQGLSIALLHQRHH